MDARPRLLHGCVEKVVNPSIAAYPAARLAKLLTSDRQAQVASVVEPPRSQPGTDRGGAAVTTIGWVGGGALAAATLLLFAVRRRRRTAARLSAA